MQSASVSPEEPSTCVRYRHAHDPTAWSRRQRTVFHAGRHPGTWLARKLGRETGRPLPVSASSPGNPVSRSSPPTTSRWRTSRPARSFTRNSGKGSGAWTRYVRPGTDSGPRTVSAVPKASKPARFRELVQIHMSCWAERRRAPIVRSGSSRSLGERRTPFGGDGWLEHRRRRLRPNPSAAQPARSGGRPSSAARERRRTTDAPRALRPLTRPFIRRP